MKPLEQIAGENGVLAVWPSAVGNCFVFFPRRHDLPRAALEHITHESPFSNASCALDGQATVTCIHHEKDMLGGDDVRIACKPVPTNQRAFVVPSSITRHEIADRTTVTRHGYAMPRKEN